MPDFLSIPGDIRQQYMPFTIEGPGQRQLFSFKPTRKEQQPCPTAIIHPFSRFLQTLIENDSSILFTHKEQESEKVDYNNFLDLIPALQIREYVPDAKLTQTFKWFSYFKKGFDAGLQNIDGKSFDFKEMRDTITETMKAISEKMKNLTSGSAKLLADVVGGLVHYYQDMGYNIGPDDGYAVLFLPFIMYYRLTTTHTNNIYELPFSMQNEIMKSDGTYGWTSTQSDFGLIDKAFKSGTDSNLVNNSITKMLLGNTIKVNMMPSFQPTGDAKGETITINIDLINDSEEAAVNNFLMCHTLFGNNRWLQYGFVQAGASLYDIKLPGANRYFMCAGQFSCKGKGAFRTPSDQVLKDLVSCVHSTNNTFADKIKNNKDLQKAIAKDIAESRRLKIEEEKTRSIEMRAILGLARQFIEKGISQIRTKAKAVETQAALHYNYFANTKKDDREKARAYIKADTTVSDKQLKELIKIPDVYSLTLTFNSLLPDNFNNYLYGFRAGNLDPILNYAPGMVDETGAFERIVKQLENAIK